MTLIQRLIFLLLSLVILLLGFSLLAIVGNARMSVNDELDSSVQTVIQLLTATLVSMPDDSDSRADLLVNISEMQRTRNLAITLRNPSTGVSVSTQSELEESGAAEAPDWFIRLVAPQAREFRQRVIMRGQAPVDIVVTADPGDEIDETWRESLSQFWLIVGFTVLTVVLLTIMIRRGLAPLARISDGLSVIAKGDFKARLDKPDLPDLDRLTSQFNQMAATLESQRKENQSLHRQMFQIQETERRKVAQELHDELGQSITAIRALAVADRSQQSEAIVGVCGQMYDSVRSLMHQLRPPLLDELGLSSAIEKLVDDWNSVHEDAFCALSITGDFSALDESQQINLYRCVQEGLNNVAKHAGADRVEASLEADDSGVSLTISDNGRGFDETTVSTGMGLIGLRERAEASGGSFSLVTSPGQGVSIAITLPKPE